MKTENKLGIWMDHSKANLMEYFNDAIETKVIESTFTHEIKEESFNKGEGLMHNKEQHKQAEYYNQLGEEIQNYDWVILFGPTEAKTELYNILKADHHFEKIKIEVIPSDKMTENQQHAFVKEHFNH